MGFVDHVDGTVIVPFDYDEIHIGLEERIMGFAGVRINQHWGLYKLGLGLVLPIEYQEVRPVHLDWLSARKSEKDSLLYIFDGQGMFRFSVPARSAEYGFNEQTVQIIRADGTRYFLNREGQDPFGGRFADGRWTDGKKVVCVRLDERGKPSQAGLYTMEGDTLLPPVYFNIQALAGGRFIVQTTDFQTGLSDERGQFIIPPGPVRLSKMGNQPQDVILALEGSPLNGKVYDPNGRLLLDSCVIGNVAYKGIHIGQIPNQYFHRYFTASRTAKSTTGLFHLDGRLILPMQYQEIQYASDDHPLIVSDSNGYTILGWNGKPAHPGRYKRLEYTPNPTLLYGQPADQKLAGFIHLGEPKRDHFAYQKIVMLERSGYFAVKEQGVWYLHDDKGQRINPKGYASIEKPERMHFVAWRKSGNPGRLVAWTSEVPPDNDASWVGFDEKGKAHDFAPLKLREEAVVAVEEVVRMDTPVPPPVEETSRQEEEIYDFPDKPAEYPGGESEKMKFMVSELKYPVLAKEYAIQGIVVVRFVVEKDGSLTNIQIVKDIGGGCGKEVVRIIERMPKWKPAKKNGMPVRSWQTFPFRFKLE